MAALADLVSSSFSSNGAVHVEHERLSSRIHYSLVLLGIAVVVAILGAIFTIYLVKRMFFRLRWQATRVARYGWRRLLRAAGAAGQPVTIPERSFHPDDRFWSRPAERAVIEGTILRAGSLSCDLFGRDKVRDTMRQFFEAGAAPVQVVGALYVFERYHQTLAASLADARRQIGTHAC